MGWQVEKDINKYPEILEVEGHFTVGISSLVRIRGKNFSPYSTVVFNLPVTELVIEIINSETIEIRGTAGQSGISSVVINNGNFSSSAWEKNHFVFGRFLQDSGWIDLRNDLSIVGEIVSYDNFLESTRDIFNSGYAQTSYGLARIDDTGDQPYQFCKFPDWKFTYADSYQCSFIFAIFSDYNYIDLRCGLMPSGAENYYNNWYPQTLGLLGRYTEWQFITITAGVYDGSLKTFSLSESYNSYNSFSQGNPVFVKQKIQFLLDKKLIIQYSEVPNISDFDTDILIGTIEIDGSIWVKYYNIFDYICPGFLAGYTGPTTPHSNALVAFRIH